MRLHIGIDDTDSINGGCTTHLAAMLVPQLKHLGASFLDYPNLIRLNPNIPYKTRGNGAVALRLEIPNENLPRVSDLVFREIESSAHADDRDVDPAAVILRGSVPKPIAEFGERALSKLLSVPLAVDLIEQSGAEALAFRDGQGLVGALAAIGVELQDDYTFELIAYRAASRIGSQRRIAFGSVVEMDRKFSSTTFGNLDPETGRVLITPRGRDPILCGIRGEDPEKLLEAFAMLRIDEPVSAWTIFRTNHGTDAHLRTETELNNIEPYSAVNTVGNVSIRPTVGVGGHVYFAVSDGILQLNCAAYEPTGEFRRTIAKLRAGDTVRVFGCIRKAEPLHEPTLNLEKIEVLKLAEHYTPRNPVCTSCGRRMQSAGRGQGFRCDKCGNHDRQIKKTMERAERDIQPGLYIPPSRANRHLTKPRCRYGRERTHASDNMIRTWHAP